jgi:hypothetical protein
MIVQMIQKSKMQCLVPDEWSQEQGQGERGEAEEEKGFHDQSPEDDSLTVGMRSPA